MASCVCSTLEDHTDETFEEIGPEQRILSCPKGQVIIQECWPFLRIIDVRRWPEYRGHAFGRNMIEGLLTYCRAEDMQPIACNVLPEAYMFWESLGFVPDPYNPCNFILAGYVEAA